MSLVTWYLRGLVLVNMPVILHSAYCGFCLFFCVMTFSKFEPITILGVECPDLLNLGLNSTFSLFLQRFPVFISHVPSV